MFRNVIKFPYPIFGDNNNSMLRNFNERLDQHRGDVIFFQKSQRFGPVRRHFAISQVELAYERQAVVALGLY